MILKTDYDGSLKFIPSIGELVIFNGRTLLTCEDTKEGNRCEECFKPICDYAICNWMDRADGKAVFFKEIKPTE